MRHRDVTGVMLHFSHEQIDTLVGAMPQQIRGFARALAETITQPHEIWKAWVADESDKGQWHNVRSYLQFLDLSKTDAGVPFGIAVVRFFYRSRWELETARLVLGTEQSVMAQADRNVRHGSLEYSIARH